MSNYEENRQFNAVCDEMEMNDDQRQRFHTWLHEQYPDRSSTDLKYHELRAEARTFLEAQPHGRTWGW